MKCLKKLLLLLLYSACFYNLTPTAWLWQEFDNMIAIFHGSINDISAQVFALCVQLCYLRFWPFAWWFGRLHSSLMCAGFGPRAWCLTPLIYGDCELDSQRSCTRGHGNTLRFQFSSLLSDRIGITSWVILNTNRSIQMKVSLCVSSQILWNRNVSVSICLHFVSVIPFNTFYDVCTCSIRTVNWKSALNY